MVLRRAWLLPLGLGWLHIPAELALPGDRSGPPLRRRRTLAPRPPVRIRDLDGHHARRGFDAVGTPAHRTGMGCGSWLGSRRHLHRAVFDRGRHRAVPALEFVGFGDPTRCGCFVDVRVGAFPVRIRAVDWGGAGGGSVLRAGIPDRLVARGGYGCVGSPAASHKLSNLWAAAAPVECVSGIGPITVALLAIWWLSGARHDPTHKKGRVRGRTFEGRHISLARSRFHLYADTSDQSLPNPSCGRSYACGRGHTRGIWALFLLRSRAARGCGHVLGRGVEGGGGVLATPAALSSARRSVTVASSPMIAASSGPA